MVRLKESFSSDRRNWIWISIPYGSIKRYGFSHLQAGSCTISIPYGSIKSPCQSDTLFGFYISIPYGSIKSNENSSILHKKEIISIPYGSIKSFIPHSVESCKSTFQFLMVRLKGVLRFWPTNVFNISIPYGSIKSTT